MNMTGKWALVTGASRGIGLRLAKALANEGCKVILHSRKMDGTKDLLNELKKQNVEAYSVAAELNDLDQVESLIKEVKEITSDNLEILYNNAAISPSAPELFGSSATEYAQCFLVNSVVPIKLCDAFLPSMLKNNWGRIVNMTSGVANQPLLMAYSCSKAALDRYVKDMVTTLKGTDVLMNSFNPGWVTTDMGGSSAPNSPESIIPGAMVPVLLEASGGSGKIYES